ncbi:MAG TPA: NAD(P)-dependent oxidoreductase [Frankiaceae bacterium]|nr:NAD(P)-dependent oxidoreductase [Frankiaceae bacterium]
MARAVVTGAAGFLGGAITHALRRRGADVVGLDVRRAPGVTVADTSRPGSWEALLAGADLVVHAAAIVADSGDPAAFWRVNVGGTAAVLDACARAGVGRVVHLSSVVVHGARFPDPVDESAPVRMTGNPYTDTKVAAEHHALAAAARGLPVTVVRPGDAYGPRSVPWTLRPVSLIRRGRLVLVDAGRGVLSPTYVDDVVEGTLALAACPAAAGEVVHVTGGVGVPAREFFGHYLRMLDAPPPRSVPSALLRTLARPLERLPMPVSPRAVEYVTHPGTYSIAKARRLAGWRPRVTLEQGMACTERWLRERGLLGVPEPTRRG